MNDRIKDVLTCPICFELLQKPVLTLPCQHNFCKVCLVKFMINGLDKNGCPTCRSKIRLATKNVDELPRNLIVEQMVAEFANDAPKYEREKEDTEEDDEDIDTLKQLAKVYITKQEFEKATNVYKKLESKFAKLEALNIKIEIFKCFVQSNEKHDLLTAQGAAIAEVLNDNNLNAVEREEASVMIKEFVKSQLIPHNFQKIALVLLAELSGMCEAIPDPDKQLEQHMLCLDMLQNVARSMSQTKEKSVFKTIGYEAITRIYRNATSIQLEDKQVQCIKISWCLKYIGFCYNETGDFEKSIEYNERSINHMKKHFKENAIRYRILGIAYHNLAAALKNLKRFSSAQESYLKALDAYHAAQDWPSSDRRNNSVILSAKGLTEVHKYLV